MVSEGRGNGQDFPDPRTCEPSSVHPPLGPQVETPLLVSGVGLFSREGSLPYP